MRHGDGRLLFSATDLSRHLSCSHLTSLRRAVALGTIERPPPYDDPRAEVLKQRGLEHEQSLLEQFTARGGTVEIITAPDTPFPERDPSVAATRTEEAMRRGADVIYQGRLQDEDGLWSGYPDFLLRVDRASRFGDWSYEALDAKLARTARGEALLQLLLYSDLLSQAQGIDPERMHLALGGTNREGTTAFRVAEYAAYYRAVRRRFEAHAAVPPETYPEPVSHCDICDWKQSCARRRRADDHLSLVAGIARGQRRRLVERGVTTMTDLAALRLPMDPRLEGVTAGALTRVREQARLQVQGQRERRHIHEPITPVEPEKGLASLPEPSDGDLFFDLEGDAFAADGGFEYLFGVADRNGGYDASWALDPESEKLAFERFIDRVMERRAQYPGLHIYHYGAYETTAVKRLMSRYATREDEVDRLLRGRVFVDLHRAVRQGLRASVESYSIKNLEPFYGYTRDVDLTAATRALVRFEAALESGQANGTAEALRAEIEGYNRDDCISTLRLAEWLENCRSELEEQVGEALPRPAVREEERDREPEATSETAELFESLTAGLPVDDADLDDDQRARRLLAYLLEFHRREDKSTWWEFFDRCGLKGDEFIEHRVTLGGLTYAGEIERVKRSIVHRYRFPEQAHDLARNDSPKNPATAESAEFRWGFCGTVAEVDDAARTIDLKRGSNSPVPHPEALIPLEVVNSGVLHESLTRLAGDVASNGLPPGSPRRAAFDLLLRSPPHLATAVSPPNPQGPDSPASLVVPGETPPEAVRRLARQLDRSILPVQGPPGSGKTHTGARAILDLLADRKRVGVTANSHKVISNLLGAVCEAADARFEADRSAAGAPAAPGAETAPVDVRGIQKAKDDDGCPDERIVQTGANDAVAAALASGEANLAGGTAWLWSRGEMAEAVDVLVIDEAGQMSLANTLAVSQAASSLVLLGDPRQLDQPIQGIHPPGADVSALGHLLGGSATADPSRGVFLDQTWRMHPDICGFTTEQFYEKRLRSRSHLDRQIVIGPGPLSGHGLRFIPVEHAGNTNASDDEAERVAALVHELLDAGAAWIDQNGVQQPLRLAEILIVAPYNAHVATLRARLPDGARVGTVDKFQGQEAPVVIYSMATSSADEAPRGMEFLYSLHRLNVATSRARCVAAIVASPTLFAPECRTPEQMRLANPFCRFLELAHATP